MTSSSAIPKARRLAKGAAALLALAALVGGIPWALWHFVGWPLPHHVPSAGQVGRALDSQAIPAQALVDALAVVVWLAWASLLAALAAEIPATLAGHHARRLPVASVLQPVAGRLVAAVVVGVLSLAPRPAAHPGAVPLASRLPPPAARPQVTLVLATATTPTGARPVAPVSADAAGPPAAGAPGATVYVVQRGDTLWGIAERELGDPLRWSEIFALNEGRPQPGGATLNDPHWIDPGWTLLLPAATPSPQAPPAPTPSPPAPAPGAAPPSSVPSTTTPAPSTTPASNGHPPRSAPHAPNRRPAVSARSQPVRLPSGSVVAGSFAAGVLSAVALGRLRRRHAYRYRPPQPGRDLTPPPLRPTLAHLASATEDAREASGEPVVRRPAAFNAERALEPGRVELGRRDGETIAVEVTDLSGVAISGPAADDVARALLAGMLAGALPGAAEILVDEGVAERLLPGARGNPALRRVPSPADAVRDAEVERVARARRLAAATAPDAPSFRRHNPEHPMPTLLVLVDAPEAEHAPRWASLAAHGPRLGMAVVYLGITEAATGRLACDAERRVTDASPVSLSDRLGGAELFGLGAEEARELLDALTEGLWDEPDHAAAGAGSPLGPEGSERPDGRGEPWPQPPTGEGGDHPLSVRVFGHLTVSVDGAPVADGLRSRAKMLLAFYLLRPEGATGEQAVDALWPETAPDQVGRQFWRAFGDLRTRLREAGGGGLDVLVKTGEHYRPSRAEIGCDLWDFEAALAGAARTEGEEEAAPALRRAVSAYGGELLEGSDWPWVAPAREDLHRRALDAHLRLAELEEASGRPDAAAAVLERAVELAGCAEEPYRRLMAHHACHGHPDALGATWRRLQRHLADLDLEVEPATARLYRALTNAGEEEGSSRPARLSL